MANDWQKILDNFSGSSKSTAASSPSPSGGSTSRKNQDEWRNILNDFSGSSRFDFNPGVIMTPSVQPTVQTPTTKKENWFEKFINFLNQDAATSSLLLEQSYDPSIDVNNSLEQIKSRRFGTPMEIVGAEEAPTAPKAPETGVMSARKDTSKSGTKEAATRGVLSASKDTSKSSAKEGSRGGTQRGEEDEILLTQYKENIAAAEEWKDDPVLSREYQRAAEQAADELKARGIDPETGEALTEHGGRSGSFDDKEKWYQGWFSKGLFEDGYDRWDVAKTILGTAGDAGENILAGIMGMGETVIDAVASLSDDAAFHGAVLAQSYDPTISSADIDAAVAAAAAEAEKFIEKDLYDEAALAKDFSTWLAGGRDVDKYSVLGDKSDSLAQSAGQLAGTAALQAVGVPWFVTTGVTSYGGEVENALNQGATLDEARISGAVTAGAEILTEKISGGIKFGGKALDDGLTDMLARGISSRFLRNAAKFGIDTTGEGLEEVLSGEMSRFGQWLTYQDEATLKEMLFSEEAMDEAIEAFIAGGVLGGGSSVSTAVNSAAHGVDAVSGLSTVEEQVVQTEYKNRLAEAEKDGKVSSREKGKIYDAVIRDMDKGYISTETIESVLGGETYNKYKDAADNEKAVRDEYEKLGGKTNATLAEQARFAELGQKVKDLDSNKQADILKKQLGKEVFGLVGESRLSNSYAEQSRKGEAFQADLTQYNEKQKTVVQKAIDSGILNNTNRTHDFVDMIAKISADKGVDFDFTNNERLKSSHFAVEGKTVNGYISDGTITVNMDSPKYAQSVTGHEVTHVLEGTELYTELQNVIFEYAKTKGEYDSRRKDLEALYKDIKDADIDGELTADLVGDYLFSDTDFVNRLSTEHRNVFQKIYDEIKYLCKVATAGSKEARELERVKRAFDKAYKAGGKASGDTKYSMSDSTGKELTKEQQDYFKDSKVRDENGSLKVMYHGSQDAGFHTFDAKFSDDDTSFFFVDRNEAAATYSGTSETYAPVSFRTVEDANKFFAANGLSEYKVVEEYGEYALYDDGDVVASSESLETLYEEFRDWSGLGYGDANYQVYLNLTNPLEVDAQGAYWNDLPSFDGKREVVLTEYDETTGRVEVIYFEDSEPYKTAVFHEADLEDVFGFHRANSLLSGKAIPAEPKTTRDYAAYAKENGYDGVIFKSIVDLGGYSNGSEGAATVAIAFDSSQIKSVANEQPTNNPDIRYSLSADSEGREISPAVQKRFSNSKVVDENGSLKVVYHGTYAGEFSIFDKSKGSVEGDFGSGFYFTDNAADVSEHYEGGGPDYENKVMRRAEQIMNEEDTDWDEAEERARNELFKGGHRFEVYLNIENPAIVGETMLLTPESYFEQYSEDDYDSYEDYEGDVEQLLTDDIDGIIWELEQNVDVVDTGEIANVLYEAFTDGGIGIEELKAKLNNLYLEDSEGNLVANEVARQIIESLGYDGIIDPTVSGKWNMDIESGTSHYIVFKPNQIKAVTNQNPTDNPNIHLSLSKEGEQPQNGRGARLTDMRLDVAPVAETVDNSTVAENTTVVPEESEYFAPPTDVAPIKTAPVAEESPVTAPVVETTPEDEVAATAETPEVAPVPEAPSKTTLNNKERGLWSHFKEKILDKGMVFENLAKKVKNRALDAKWNFTRYAGRAAQEFINSGAEGVTALNDIRKAVEKSGKTADFEDYLKHALNMDRMSLADRKLGNNKPVFGDGVTAEDSRKKVEEYEKANPEFVELANQVYAYNAYLRQMMVDNGIITPELSELWATMYPHYVSIPREGFDDSIAPSTSRDVHATPWLKRAIGGNQKIKPLLETMADRAVQTYKAVAKNNFGLELMNTLKTEIASNAVDANGLSSVNDAFDILSLDDLLQPARGGKNPTFTVFQDGKRVTFEITEEMFEALSPTSDALSKTVPILNKASNLHRGVLTEYNPMFLATNAIKDAQDVLFNSQHAGRTYANLLSGRAYYQYARKGKWYKEYIKNGGGQNTYFDRQTKQFVDDKTYNPLKWLGRKISAANDFIETAPRLAEYMASREMGRSIEESMLDASRVTTNFAAGGDVAKFANRNGATFLNASIQGAVQQVRNVREAWNNGFAGVASLAGKAALAGVAEYVFNHMIWEDDEEFAELQDYVKQNYYVVWKNDDGTFIRIPKGRTLAVIQEAMNLVGGAMTGEEVTAKDLVAFKDLIVNNLAPNNPFAENVISPFMQVGNNTAWHGGEIENYYMQQLPTAERYDEGTDELSMRLGQTELAQALDLSPIEINYMLDQYSGGLGDVFLPMFTPQAESNVDGFGGKLLAPLRDKFTTDSTMKNQNVTDFYDIREEMSIAANSSNATEEDIIRDQYFYAIKGEMDDLYAQKREIQSGDLPDSEKYEEVRAIQRQIDDLAEEALTGYSDVSINGAYAEVGNRRFNYDSEDGVWYPIREKKADGSDNYYYQKEQEVTKGLGISYAEYWNNREEYNFAYDKPGEYAIAQATGDYESYMEHLGYLQYGYDFDKYLSADKDENGETIDGSRQRKVVAYLDSLDLDPGQWAILYRTVYDSKAAKREYNQQIVDYLYNNDDISRAEMEAILLELDFNIDSEGRISW